MIVKMLLVGNSGAGKTHMCVEIAKVTKAALIDVDQGAEEIIQKLDAESVVRLSGTPFQTFVQSLNTAIKSADMIIIDSVTELKLAIAQYIKNKVMEKGEFYVGGVQRDEPKKIADKDLFVLVWELYPVIYDRIRDITRFINSKEKSYIMTYHPPFDKASKGEVEMFTELVRISNITAYVSEGDDRVMIKKDRFFNFKEMSRDEFINYVKILLESKHIKEAKEKMGVI